jgi:outer membrane receptor for ferrienterochelin and colicins
MIGLDLASIAIYLLVTAVTPDVGAEGSAPPQSDGAAAPESETDGADGRAASPVPLPGSQAAPNREPAASGPALDNLRDSVDIDVAAPESFDSVSLEEILNMQVVTATGEEEDRALAPANVFVVTREDIVFHGYRSMAELLAGVPGLFVTDDLVSPSVAVNGVSGGLHGGTRIMRTMINGVEVNFRPDLTAFLGPEYIPMDAIERVEIAKGPLSALYGANAFVATVNVITRVPAPGTSSMVAGWLSRLRGGGGFGASGSLGFNDGHKSFFASFVLDEVDRSGMGVERTFPGQQYSPELFTGRSRNDVRQSAGTFLSFRTAGERLGALSLQGGLQSFDTGTEFQINSLFGHASRLALANAWSSARWERTWSRLIQTDASLGWSQGQPTRNTQLYLPDSRAVMFKPNYSYGALTGKLEVGLAPSRTLSFAAGVDAEHDRQRILYYTQVFNVAVGQNQPGDQVEVGIAPDEPHTVTVQSIGGYLKAGVVPLPDRLPDLRLTGNLRADTISQGEVSFPWQTSWRTAVAYRVSPTTSAKLIVGRAFQVPSAVLNFARPGYGTIGNIVGVANVPGADPLRHQSVTSVQAAVSARLFGNFALESEVYYQDVKDRIEFIRYGANYRAANQGDAKQVGLAGILRFVRRPLSLYLSGNVLRNIVDGRLSEQPPSAFPGATAAVGGNLDLPRWYLRLNTETRYVAARGASGANVVVNNQELYSLPSYTQTDLTLSFNPHPFGVGTETTLMVGVRNLFDVTFSEPGYGGFDIPGMGRLVFLEARQAF